MWKAELTILYGGRRKRFEVCKQTLSIGRSPDNDVVLQDPAASARHCEIRYKEGKFFIIDKESSNGTWLNGRQVSRAELLPGAKVSVGDTTLILAPLGFQTGFAQKVHPRLSLKSRNFNTICIVILVLGAVFVFSRHVRQPGKVWLDTTTFEVDMVEESGGFGKLSRSQISISAGSLHFYFDDLGRGRHLYREAKLSGEEIDELRKKIMNSSLFKISVVNHSSSEGANLLTISAKLDSLERKVSFSKDLPEGIASFKEELEFLAAKKFNFPSLALSREELVGKAEKAFERGKLFYSERERRCDNLFNSICAFRKTFWYLETVEPKPSFLPTVEEYLYRSQEDLTDKFNKLRFQAERAMRLLEWDDARANLEGILARVPDKTDERHKYAMRRLEKVRKR